MHINLGNSTNNRIESLNQKIKDVLDRNMSISEAIQGLLLICRSTIYGVRHRSFVQMLKVPYRLNDDDRLVDELMKKLTPYAASIVASELKSARVKMESYATNDVNCCPIRSSMGLPCRHVFASRIKDQEESLFCESDVLARWCIGYGNEVIFKRDLNQISTAESETTVLAPPQNSQLSKRSKPTARSKEEQFRDMMVVCKTMADLSSNLGSDEYLEKMDTLKHLYDMWCKGQKVVLVE